MQTSLNKRLRRKFLKCGRKLLAQALDGFYYFKDDAVEDKIEQALVKYKHQGRVAVRSYILSHEDIRNKICQAGFDIYGTV